MLRLFKFFWQMIKSTMSIAILLGALIIAPLFIAAQFLPLLQGFISELAENYLPHPTVSSIEKKRRVKAEADANTQRRNNKKLVDENRIHKRNTLALAEQNRRLKTQNSQLEIDNERLAKNASSANSSRTTKTKLTLKKVKSVSNRGTRILRRGATALGVGWVPYAGGAYDLYALKQDFSDVCDLLKTIDELSELLFFTSTLYKQSYCHKPAEAIDMLRGQ